MSMISGRAQRRIENSRAYASLNREIINEEKEDCQLEHAWQRTVRPVCNSLHELDLTCPVVGLDGSDKYKFLTHGYYRDVLEFVDEATLQRSVLKPMRYKHNYSEYMRCFQESSTMARLIVCTSGVKRTHVVLWLSDFRNFDRMRRDGLVMDELTGSKYILDIYAFCGTSGLFEYADGGDFEDALWPRDGRQSSLSQLDKLHMGT